MGVIIINSGNASGLFCKFTIFIDEKKIETLNQNSKIKINVEKGKHVLQAKDSGAFSKSEKLEFKIQNDETKNIYLSSNGFKYQINFIEMDSFKNEMIICSTLTPELKEIINLISANNEDVKVAIKGAFREYLICTNKNVYIIKKGYMTGHFFGEGNFHISYNKITNIEIDIHLLTGYFEISAGGLENKRLNYWSNDANCDPSKQPNCISINRDIIKNFEKARDFILNYNEEIKQSNESTLKSIPGQIREYKQLFDDGIISKKDFDKKKEELLKNGTDNK